MQFTAGSWYWKGVKDGLIYQFKGEAVPSTFVDSYGNPQQVVENYTNPAGVTQNLVICLPYGGVQQGYAGPPSIVVGPPIMELAPGHIFSPWEEQLPE